MQVAGIVITAEGIGIVISLLGLLAGLVAIIARTSRWYGEVDTRLKSIEKQQESNVAEHNSIIDKATTNDKTSAELSTCIDNINGRLMRIENTLENVVSTLAELAGEMKSRRL